jgi:GT2 family glycosyltransferase/glycosyltransferase involved in cell wall biosynthesis
MDTNVASHQATGFARLPVVMDELDIGVELEWQPDYQAESAWHEHIPFAFWLIKALRPRSIVELGSHWGVSYAAFCQAVERFGLAARCHAIDTWQGDPHAGEYGEEVFATIAALNERRWRRFSTLLRTTFADARGYFGAGEVDLLHIDGFHTYEATAGDFRLWQDTISDRGVVLFHDTNVRERQFGVWRLWQELKAQYPHFEFVHGHGLGVLGLGGRLPEPVAALFEASADPARAATIRGLFSARGEAVRHRYLHDAAANQLGAATQQAAALTSELVSLREGAAAAQAAVEAMRTALETQRKEAAALRAERDALATEAAALRGADLERDRLRQEAAALGAERDALATQAAALRGADLERDRLRQEAAALRAERDSMLSQKSGSRHAMAHADGLRAVLQAEVSALREHRDAIIASTSWRLTKPLRVAVRLARGDSSDLGRLRSRLLRRRPGPMEPRAPLLAPMMEPMPQPANAVAGAPLRAIMAEPPPGLPSLPAPRFERVDIVVCVHNAPEDVRRCLASVLACTMPPFRLVLVDDGSAAETRDLLAGFAREHHATLIRHEVAQGYTRAANAGLRASDAPWVVLLNSDTIVTLGWLDRMVEQAGTDARIGILGPLSNTASWQSVPQVQEGGDWAENPLPPGIDVGEMARIVAAAAARQAIPMPFLNGFCLLLRRQVIEEVGLFDETSFGDGYGEENDYCVRARKAGWKLVAADDAFVFHAQSRSYSHERRKTLVERADRVLVEKHDPKLHIWPQVHACKDSLAMVGLRARIAMGVQRRRVIAETRARFEGRRVAFLLPVCAEGGGANVVLQEARALARMGVDATLINLAVNRLGFEASYGTLDLPVLYAASPVEARVIAADPRFSFDAVIATACQSVAWLPEDGPTPAYYIQDYEPWFFPTDDPRHAEAEATYRGRPELRRFTKTHWNARRVEMSGGLTPTVIGLSVDAELFRPAPDALPDHGGPVRIAAMVRPATPRRQPALTVQVLQALRVRFGDGVVLSAFGADDAELAAAGLDLSGIHNHGRLGRKAMAALLGGSDVFLDLSDYQAMGLTALEAMASGCAVLVPERGGAVEFAEGGNAALATDTADPAAATAAAIRLVEDAALRARLRLRAVAVAPCHSPEFAAARLLDAVLG